MAKFNQLFFFSLMLLFLVSSCGKYDNGPALSFLTEEKRLCRSWTLEKMEHANGYSTNEYFFQLKMEKDKSLQIEHKNSLDEVVTTASTWEWFMVDYGVILNLGYHPQGLPSGTVIFEIKRLTKKELWIQDRASLITYHFKSE
jgi:hypothetical protein